MKGIIMILDICARTEPGLVRGNNEDNFYICGIIKENPAQTSMMVSQNVMDDAALFAVCDGMGGEELGEIAALLAVQALTPCSFREVKLHSAADIVAANESVCKKIQERGGRRIGSTIAALYIDDGKAMTCNVGDSRVYYLPDGGHLRQLTVDHNEAQRLVNMGILTPQAALSHPSKNKLTQHLGIFPDELLIEPSYSATINYEPGDKFFLCSDGVVDMVYPDVLCTLLRQYKPLRQIEDEICSNVLAAGAKDNFTAILIEVKPDESEKTVRDIPY